MVKKKKTLARLEASRQTIGSLALTCPKIEEVRRLKLSRLATLLSGGVRKEMTKTLAPYGKFVPTIIQIQIYQLL